MLRALALFNIYPPTYDMAILKDITTSTFPTKSVIYLHGQHHGLWLLNTEEELKKVNEVIPPILNSIKDRPWIFIGYSANDPIFDHIAKLGRFDKGLYWIARRETSVSDKVRKELLDKENTNSFFIEGYDSDSFMLELNTKLGLEQPEILEKPFSYLKNCLDNIVDIQDEEHFKGIKERLEIIKTQVSKSIDTYENKDIENNLIKEIIDLSLKENFNEKRINELYQKSQQSKNQQLKNSLANLFNKWGINFTNLGKVKKDENLFIQAIEKYETASKLNLKDDSIFNNWGSTLYNLAKAKNNDENLYNQAFEKFESAFKLNPKKDSIFFNWGTALCNLAEAKNYDDNLYNQAFEKFETALRLNPRDFKTFSNWGIALCNLAKAKNNDEDLYNQAFEKLSKAVELGSGVYNLACFYSIRKNKKEALELLEKAIENKETSISHILDDDDDWNNFKEDEDFKKLIKKYS
jgi:tetratricopeptide (TPR) repeat protein